MLYKLGIYLTTKKNKAKIKERSYFKKINTEKIRKKKPPNNFYFPKEGLKLQKANAEYGSKLIKRGLIKIRNIN